MTDLQTLVLRILANGDQMQDDATELAKLAATMPYAKFNDAVAVIVGTKYSVEPHKSRKGGLLTFTKESAPEQRFKRLIKLHPKFPTTKPAARSAKTEPVKVPAHVLALAKQLAKAAGNKSLANTALALAFAK